MASFLSRNSHNIRRSAKERGHCNHSKDHKGDASDNEDGVNCFHRARLKGVESGV